VIGGLISKGAGESISGVPFLKNIPLIGGLLFGSTSRPAESNFNRMLMIFVTPYVIRPDDSTLAPEPLKEYEERRIEVLPQTESGFDADNLRDQLTSLWEQGPEIADTEPAVEEETESATTDKFGEKLFQKPTEPLHLAHFRFNWAEAADVIQGVRQRLSRRGTVVNMSSTDEFQIISLQDVEANIDTIHQYLIAEEKAAAREQGSLMDIDDVELDISMLEQTDTPATDDRFDPLKEYTNWTTQVKGPVGSIERKPGHIYSVNKGQSASTTNVNDTISARRDRALADQRNRSGPSGRRSANTSGNDRNRDSDEMRRPDETTRPPGLNNPNETLF
jgi:hypothetical protein